MIQPILIGVFLYTIGSIHNRCKDLKGFVAQDRSPFCIFYVMNEIWLHPELIDIFLVGTIGNFCWEDYTLKCSQHLKKH